MSIKTGKSGSLLPFLSFVICNIEIMRLRMVLCACNTAAGEAKIWGNHGSRLA
jgi:hypothetical protein